MNMMRVEHVKGDEYKLRFTDKISVKLISETFCDNEEAVKILNRKIQEDIQKTVDKALQGYKPDIKVEWSKINDDWMVIVNGNSEFNIGKIRLRGEGGTYYKEGNRRVAKPITEILQQAKPKQIDDIPCKYDKPVHCISLCCCINNDDSHCSHSHQTECPYYEPIETKEEYNRFEEQTKTIEELEKESRKVMESFRESLDPDKWMQALKSVEQQVTLDKLFDWYIKFQDLDKGYMKDTIIIKLAHLIKKILDEVSK